MSVNLSSLAGAGWQFFNNDGIPLSGGFLYTYLAGTSTPATTYTSSTGLTANSNPIVLDAAGRTPQEIWLTDLVDYKFILRDSANNLIGTYDNIPGINSFAVFADLLNTTTYPPGDALVGFRQSQSYPTPGFVAGSVGKTVNDKFQEFISVKDFGATGNGSTDDTAAIQAAITYCTSLSNRKQTLYFPAQNAAASYKITAPLVVNGRLNIVGDGEFSTLIYAVGMTAGQFMIDFNNEAADVVYFGGMRQITLRSDNGQPTAIRLRNASYWTFKNVQMYGVAKGIYVTGTSCFSNFFEEVTGYQISSYTVQMDNFTGGGQYMFVGCTFTGSDGFYITNTAGTDGLGFYDCNFEQCVVTDMLIYGSVRGLTVSGCRSEGLNGVASILLRPDTGKVVQGVSITGNFWQTDSGNAYAVSIGGSAGKVEGFSITGNDAGYIGFLGFVHLNGDGESGVISGNYCENAPVVANGAPRAGVVIYANSNSSGALPEYWGNATWGVTEGSFTPIDTSGAGLTLTGTVRYTKIGRVVNWQAYVVYPATGSTAAASFGGFPIAIGGLSGSNEGRAGATVNVTNYSSFATGLLHGLPSNTSVAFYNNTTGAAALNNNITGSYFYCSGTYMT